jgi:DNA-binding NtrC family response regulator
METSPNGNLAQKRWVLVVDDEPGIRELLKWHFSSNGFDVEVAKNGAEAIEHLREEDKFALVITDLTMPKLDGLKLLEELKGRGSEVPIVIVTGFGTVETAVYAMKKGASDFILKPFNLDHLLSAVKQIIAQD